MPVMVTSFHRFVPLARKGNVIPLTSDNRSKLYYFTGLLNYVEVEHANVFGASSVFDITKDMMNCFFQSYAMRTNSKGEPVGEATIQGCIETCTATMYNLCSTYGNRMSVSPKDLYHSRVARDEYGREHTVNFPEFVVRSASVNKQMIFRDMPLRVFEVFINEAFRYTPDVSFAFCLCAFGGLRPSEACNVTREDSPIRKGLEWEWANGNDLPSGLTIHLEQEYCLRSDHVSVGKIKKERTQKVPLFCVPALYKAYCLHMEYMKTRAYEIDYGPMFVNLRNMALTYNDFTNRFKMVVNEHMIPVLKSLSNSNEMMIYGHLLKDVSLAGHVLRHFFTVQLVVHKYTIAQIMNARGDKDLPVRTGI